MLQAQPLTSDVRSSRVIVTMKPDGTWANMEQAARLLNDQYCEGDTLRVTANRRSTGLLKVAEGLAVWDNWTDVFEPVRERRLWRGSWNTVQTLEKAAEQAEAFLRRRPDQAPSERDL